MKNSLTLILLLTTLLFYAQQRSVNKLGVETIRYGKIVKSYIDVICKSSAKSVLI
jgi:hypothetical protein